jgi:gliding motility-associated-like protein
MIPLGPTGLDSLVITINSPSICTGIGIINVFTFYINDPPPFEATGYDVNVQCGGQAELVPVFINGYAPFSLDWNIGGAADTLMVAPLEFTSYSATLTDTCGRTATAAFNVGLVALPPMYMTLIGGPTVIEGCESAQLNVLRPWEMEGDLTIHLATQGAAQQGVDFNLPSSVIIPDGNFNVLVPFETIADGEDEGDQTVMVIATFTDACGRSVDSFVEITIQDAPEIHISDNEFFFPCSSDTVSLWVDAWGGHNNELTITWEGFDDLEGATIHTPVTFTRAITVTATDACGTQETAIVNIFVDCDLIVPNVFSPNGDNMNDFWEIQGIQYTNNEVRVFNRWGKLVYEQRNYQNNWRATDLPDGTYFYEIIVENHKDPYKGYVTVLRSGS